jgi:hypothetical protein
VPNLARPSRIVYWAACGLVAVSTACSSGSGGDGATATRCPADSLMACARPNLPPSYYIDQAQRYFDALDRSAPPDRVPTYSERVARWEWPPWLKLTGYTKAQLEQTDKLVKQFAPAVVSARDCRFFVQQPFARCRVSFDYDSQEDAKGCPIYEEFVFNEAGEITFVEAWSDLPGLTPITDPADPWAERSAIHRMASKLPGLGSPSGLIDPQGAAMQKAAKSDPEVQDFIDRTMDFWGKYAEAGQQSGPDYFTHGCGW